MRKQLSISTKTGQPELIVELLPFDVRELSEQGHMTIDLDEGDAAATKIQLVVTEHLQLQDPQEDDAELRLQQFAAGMSGLIDLCTDSSHHILGEPIPHKGDCRFCLAKREGRSC